MYRPISSSDRFIKREPVQSCQGNVPECGVINAVRAMRYGASRAQQIHTRRGRLYGHRPRQGC